jgi:predicted alpha/beta superfamily hydrolase
MHMSRAWHPGHLVRVASRLSDGIVLVACVAAQAWAQPHPAQGPMPGGREELLSITHVPIASKAFHTVHDVSVWLPSQRAPGVRYPVLVFPDAEELGQFRSALANVQFLIDRQLIPPMMVVGIPYLKNRRHELTPAATGSTAQVYPMAGGADVTLQFISDEVLPWVDAHYPTLPVRILAGHSLGGLFALYVMATHPDVFRIVIAMSPVLRWNDGTLSTQVAASIAGDTSRERTLFVTSGGREPSIDEPTTVFATRLQALLDSAPNARLRFERRRYPLDIHEMTPLDGLVDGLRMAYDPIVVPIDSVVTALSDHHVEDTATIRESVRTLESRYTANAASLGVPAPFPETPLDILGSYSFQVKHPDLAVRLFRENCDRYPHSSNAHESLGEGLVAVGDTVAGVAQLRQSIAIAKVAMGAAKSILVMAHERDVRDAAVAQLHALHQDVPGA